MSWPAGTCRSRASARCLYFRPLPAIVADYRAALTRAPRIGQDCGVRHGLVGEVRAVEQP